MRNLPFAAQLILQEMRHYRLILKLEEMNLPDLDTDAHMIGLCDTVAALLGLPAQRPEAWENTYALYVDEVKRFDINVPVLHREGGIGSLGPAMLRGPAYPGGGNETGLANEPGAAVQGGLRGFTGESGRRRFVFTASWRRCGYIRFAALRLGERFFAVRFIHRRVGEAQVM